MFYFDSIVLQMCITEDSKVATVDQIECVRLNMDKIIIGRLIVIVNRYL